MKSECQWDDATLPMFSRATQSHHNAIILDKQHNHKNIRDNQK